MTCTEALEAISAALDGDLKPGERWTLEEHLRDCPACRELWEELSAQSQALRELDCAVPDELRDRILSNLPRRKRRPAGRRWTAAAACLALILLTGLGVWRYKSVSAAQDLAEARAAEEPALAGGALDGGGCALASDEEPGGGIYCLSVAAAPEEAIPAYLDSAEALEDYLAAYSDEPLAETLEAQYGADYFASAALLAVPWAEGEPEVEGVRAEGGNYSVVVRSSGEAAQARDTASAWLILIETDNLPEEKSAEETTEDSFESAEEHTIVVILDDEQP